jgi:hypothetical protein
MAASWTALSFLVASLHARAKGGGTYTTVPFVLLQVCQHMPCVIDLTHRTYAAGVAEREAGVVPGAVGYAFSRELLAPMEQWLWAHQVAQVRLSAYLFDSLSQPRFTV